MDPDLRREPWSSRLADLAVAGRTAALRALSPFEALVRKLGAREDGEPAQLPPLWLRRHAGPIRAFRSSGVHAMALLERLGLLRPDLRVLDFGCGPGSLVPRFAAHLGTSGRYRGLDIHAPSIDWCRRQTAGDARFSFETLDPRRPAAWPVEPGVWDLVLAKSVFTHLLEPEAKAALGEVGRALAPGGRAVVTAFLFDGPAYSGRKLPWFPCPGETAAVRWRRASRPTAAVAVDLAEFRGWTAAAGLRVESIVPGYHPGGSEPPTGQDTLVLAAGAEEG
jgi:SAM-dependent methyltransferase